MALLTERELIEWHHRLPANLAHATVRRIINDFREDLPPELPAIIKNGLASPEAESPVAREAQILSDIDVRRIIEAAREVDAAKWGDDLYRLILVLAATGMRFSQVVRIRISDVQAQRLVVPVSNKGRGPKHAHHVAVRVGDDVIKALKPATADRKDHEPLLERWRWKQSAPTQWERDRRGPWSSASELLRPWKAVVARAELPSGLVPYCLRHSSIVRGLRAGLPIRLVAGLHDTSTAMIEAHYSRFIVDAMDELAARAIVPLTSTPVADIRRVGSRQETPDAPTKAAS